jgi:hypothetical protein
MVAADADDDTLSSDGFGGSDMSEESEEGNGDDEDSSLTEAQSSNDSVSESDACGTDSIFPGSPSTGVITEENKKRQKAAFLVISGTLGGAKPASLRFSCVFQFAAGVLNEDSADVFLARYSVLNSRGNLFHLPQDRTDKLRHAYNAHCDESKQPKSVQLRLRSKARFADFLQHLQIGRKCYYICRNDGFHFASQASEDLFPSITSPHHWFYEALAWRCDGADTFAAAKRLAAAWDDECDGQLVRLCSLEQRKTKLRDEARRLADGEEGEIDATKEQMKVPNVSLAESPNQQDENKSLRESKKRGSGELQVLSQASEQSVCRTIEVVETAGRGRGFPWAQLSATGTVAWSGYRRKSYS